MNVTVTRVQVATVGSIDVSVLVEVSGDGTSRTASVLLTVPGHALEPEIAVLLGEVLRTAAAMAVRLGKAPT